MIVVGLCGVAGVGKDVGAAALVRDLGFERIGFADALRAAVYALDPCIFQDGDYYESAISLAREVDEMGWEKAKREYTEVRRLLQRMGTEVGRAIFGENVWVDALFDRADREGVKRLVIPDVRFPNEWTAVLDRGGIVYRITRPGFAPVNAHASDNALTDGDFVLEETVANNTTEFDYQLRLVGEVARLIKGHYFA